jgi:hypothetical protein
VTMQSVHSPPGRPRGDRPRLSGGLGLRSACHPAGRVDLCFGEIAHASAGGRPPAAPVDSRLGQRAEARLEQAYQPYAAVTTKADKPGVRLSSVSAPQIQA